MTHDKELIEAVALAMINVNIPKDASSAITPAMVGEANWLFALRDAQAALDAHTAYMESKEKHIEIKFTEEALARHNKALRDETIERCAKECESKVERPADYQGRFGGHGNFMGDKTGPECAKTIRALKDGG